ncbi:MAG: hypothetical protein Q7T45_13945 [Bradyrhizobium sp.]|uniref:hypothetical protein n=1 Tax=Bradyrhizobium sp. TaxID=376 RepID=UPI00271B801E|nr:hypothetical protein [Bradyrhizobium sp.]MDO8398914.1 hypothetical protein [Bradyrhizobium sp.]
MKSAKKQKQEQVNFRTTPDVKARIQAEADARGITFNKEVNRRLQDSLAAPDQHDLTHVPGLLAIATAMNVAGQYACLHSSLSGATAPTKWWDDPYAYDQAVRAANRIFEALRPTGKISKPTLLSGKAGTLDLGAVAENLGVGLANGVISEIASDEPTTTTAIARAPKLRADLGADLVTRLRAFKKRGQPK